MGQGQFDAAEGDSRRLSVYGNDLARDQVGITDEIGDEPVRWPLLEVPGRPLLGDNGFVHDDDPVGDRQRLFLVVGHVDRGQAQVLLQFELR